MEGLPAAKAERVAAMRRELADLQRQLIEAQQRIATELQGRADDAERFEALEARAQAQDVKAQQDAARIGELEKEIFGMRPLLASLTTSAADLRRDLAARDLELEDARRQHRDVTDQLEAQSSSLRETKAQLEARAAEHAEVTRELEAQRKQHGEVTQQLESHAASLRDAKALVATRDAELTAMTSERDALKGELEAARRDLDAVHAKARDVASQLVRLGHDLTDGEIVPASAPPTPRTPIVDAQPTAARPAASRSGLKVLLLLAGVLVLGSTATYAIVKSTESSPSAVVNRDDPRPPPPSPVAAPVEARPAPDPAVRREDSPTLASGANVTDTPKEELATDGVIVLPEAAAGHRVFVDGQLAEVKSSRVVVPCGSREVRIGSRGAAQTLDVKCGGETTLPAHR